MTDNIFDTIIELEGGYVNDPDDPGGETNYGIAKRFYPNEDIAGMTPERAKEIYRRDYYQKHKLYLLEAFIAHRVLLAGVNIGMKTAIKILQRIVGVEADGLIGPKTQQAVVEQDYYVLIDKFALEQIKYYVRLSDNKPVLRKFLRGWIKRALHGL